MQIFICCVILLNLFYQCFAQEKTIGHTEKKSRVVVDEIFDKINKISVHSLSKAPNDSKVEILRKLENKLSKAAKPLGEKGEKYVKLIMKGIKEKTLEEKTHNTSDTHVKFEGKNDNIINDKFIIELSKKLEYLENSNLTTMLTQGRHIIKEAIKQNILETAGMKPSDSRNETKEQEKYNDSFDERIDLILIKLLNNTRRMSTDHNGNNENFNSKNFSASGTSTVQYLQLLTPGYECENMIDRICLNIKQMKDLKCRYDDSVVPVEKLCNGYADCPDRTDEKFCTSQVTERIRNANSVISEVDESLGRNCLPQDSRSFLMSSQNIIFRDVLKAQEDFVEKYKYLNWSILPNANSPAEGSVQKTVNEITLVISTLSLALDASLCAQRASEFAANARKFSGLLEDDFSADIKEAEWPPKSCMCIKDRCENNTCVDNCKRVCWQKYSLTQWGCESIDKTENVPLDTICDGKFDCFDESDEKGCVTGVSFAKFEAHEIFKDVLKIVSEKLTHKELSIRNLYVSLYHVITNLQKSSMAPETDIKVIRRLRNKYFSTLSSIYSELLNKSTFVYETEEAYLFLLSLNEKIVTALKRSHTGNKKIIESDGCYCRNAQCSMPLCSRKCIRKCLAEPILTRYICEGNNSNKSVAIDAICNGTPNCPHEDDEANCKEEVCRQHHLTVLRHSLEKIGKKQAGTSMGELIEKWKTKVSSTLMVTENNGRPTPIIVKDIIKEILNDLVMTYGAVEGYRRNNEYALDEFSKIARHVMQTLKSCRM